MLRYNPGYETYQMPPMVEPLGLARGATCPGLDHDPTDTLRVENPDDLDRYFERTGNRFHRLYRDLGDVDRARAGAHGAHAGGARRAPPGRGLAAS